MKILLVAINFDPEPTGIGPYVGSLARGLQEQGHEVRVITGIPHYPTWTNASGYSRLVTHEDATGIPVTRIRHYIPAGGIGAKRVVMELTFGLGAILSGWGRPDVVVSVSPPLFATLMVTARAKLTRGGPSVVAWTQDLYTRGFAELSAERSLIGRIAGRVAKFVEGTALRSADSVIVIDERFRTFVRDFLGVPDSRVSVHRNWVHLALDAPAVDPKIVRQQLGWGDAPIALHAGSMGEKQGLEHVVEAAKQAEASGSSTRFVLMGDGSRRALMEQLGAGCKNLDIIDPLPGDLFLSALRAADVLLICEKPGVKEMALPSKLTSYFTAGRPVVASSHPEGTAALLIETAEAGKLVAPGDAAGLLAAVESLVADPVIAQAHGASGRLYAHEHMLQGAAVGAIAKDLEAVRNSHPELVAAH